jgi:hypothetical protein
MPRARGMAVRTAGYFLKSGNLKLCFFQRCKNYPTKTMNKKARRPFEVTVLAGRRKSH